MAEEIVMPRLGWTMEEGTLVEWLKADGDQVEAGKQSLAFSLRLRSPDRTLEDRDAEVVVERVLQRLETSFQARLR